MKLFKREYYEKLFGLKSDTVQDYQAAIQNAQQKIKELQDKCKHESFTVMFYSWRVGSYHPQRVCDSCNAVVPGITEEEQAKQWKEWGKTQVL